MSVVASDESHVTANGGGGGLSLEGATGIGLSATVGLSAATDNIGDKVYAFIDGSKVIDNGNNVSVAATEQATISTLTIGGAVSAGSGGVIGAGVGFAGAGSGNTIGNNVEASVRDGATVTTTGSGGVSVEAQDTPTIDAIAGALGLTVGNLGLIGFGLSAGNAYASNSITDHVLAYVDQATIGSAGGVTVSASETATITSLTIGAAVAAGGDVQASVAGDESTNTLANDVEAYVADGSTVTAKGAVKIEAIDQAISRANGGGGGLSIAGGTIISVGIAVGFGVASNTMTDKVLAYVDGSSVTDDDNNVGISATEDATLTAFSIGGAGVFSGGGDVAVALAGGGCSSTNTTTNTVKAYAQNGSIATSGGGGDVSISALDTVASTATAGGGSLAITVSPSGGSAAVGAAIAENHLGDTVSAYGNAETINSAGAIDIMATSKPTVTAVSIAATFSASISLGVASRAAAQTSDNTIDNHVSAYLQGASAAAKSAITAAGAVNVGASEIGSITANVGSVDVAFAPIGGSIGVSLSTNKDDSTITADIDNAGVSTGSLTISASSNDKAKTVIDVTSVAVSLGGAGAGGNASAMVAPIVSAYAGSGADLKAAGDLSITASSTGSRRCRKLWPGIFKHRWGGR